jgi:hypothetical protein
MIRMFTTYDCDYFYDHKRKQETGIDGSDSYILLPLASSFKVGEMCNGGCPPGCPSYQPRKNDR